MTATRRRAGSAENLVALVVAVGAFLYLLRATAGQWFFYDDWDFLNQASGSLPLQPFMPHNGHPSLLPTLIYDALYHTVGLRAYWPYMAFVLAAHVAVAELSRRLLRRLGAGVVLAFAAELLILLFGAGWENIIWAFQIGFVGAVACGLGALLLLDGARDRRRPRVAASVLLVAGLQCSSVGAVMVVVVVAWMVLAGRVRRDWAVLIAPIVLYGVWLAAERHNMTQVASSGGLHTVPEVIWYGLSGAYGQLSGSVLLGAVLGAAVLALGVRSLLRDRVAQAMPVAMAFGALVFMGLVALQRAGVDTASSSRYLYVVAVLTLPLLVSGVVAVARRMHGAGAIVAAVAVVALLVAVGYNTHVLRDQLAFWSAVKQSQRGRFLATTQLLAAGDRPVSEQPDPQGMPQLTWEDIAQFDREGVLGHPGRAVDNDVFAARAYLDVAVATMAPPTVATASTCVAGSSALRLQVAAPEFVSVETATSTTLSVQIAPSSNPDNLTYPRQIPLPAGTSWLDLSLTGFDVVLGLPSDAQVCGP